MQKDAREETVVEVKEQLSIEVQVEVQQATNDALPSSLLDSR